MWPPEEHERLIENMSAWMDGELPDIASTPEAGGPDDLELEVAEHQACCPSCRDLFEELKELRAGFETLPEPDPPEGFAQGVLDRIREEARPKVIPLFKRPQVRALAGLAACLVLVAGLYGVSRGQEQDKWMLTVRSFNRDVVEEYADISAQESLRSDGDGPRVNAALADPETGDAPQIAAYTAPGEGEMQKAAPNPAAEGLDSDRSLVNGTTTLERMPEGAVELIPPETAVTPTDDRQGSIYWNLPLEILDQIERLAQEQGIGVTAERCSAPEAEVQYNLMILQQNH